MLGDSDETTGRKGDEKNWLWSQAHSILNEAGWLWLLIKCYSIS